MFSCQAERIHLLHALRSFPSCNPSPTWWEEASLIYTHRAYAHEATPQRGKQAMICIARALLATMVLLPLRHEAEQAH
jgi:hypothetical protein